MMDGMKKTLILLALLLALAPARAQTVAGLYTRYETALREAAQVRVLDLSGQALDELPDLAPFVRLEVLDISNTGLTKLPANLRSLPKLAQVRAKGLTRMNWPQAAEILAQVPALAQLDMSGCGLVQIPPAVLDIKLLTHLSLDENNLASIPEDIDKLKNLQSLHLQGPFGRLPEGIARLKYLESLSLEGDNLDMNNLSEGLARLTSLRSLSIRDQNLRKMPEAIRQLASLEYLSLEGARLVEVSLQPGELPRLAELHLSNCPQLDALRFFETAPSLTELRVLVLDNCGLRELPEDVKRLRRLKSLNLNNNQLTNLPTELEELGGLEFLNLNGNPLDPLVVRAWDERLRDCRISFQAPEEVSSAVRVAPPVPRLRVETQRFSVVDPTWTNRFSTRAGNMLVFPPDAFARADGSLAEGPVEVIYREFMDAADIYLSGVPMETMVGGRRSLVESCGMVEIYALEEGQRLNLRPQALPSMVLFSDNPLGSSGLYQLDAQAGWLPNPAPVETYPTGGLMMPVLRQPPKPSLPEDRLLKSLRGSNFFPNLSTEVIHYEPRAVRPQNLYVFPRQSGANYLFTFAAYGLQEMVFSEMLPLKDYNWLIVNDNAVDVYFKMKVVSEDNKTTERDPRKALRDIRLDLSPTGANFDVRIATRDTLVVRAKPIVPGLKPEDEAKAFTRMFEEYHADWYERLGRWEEQEQGHLESWRRHLEDLDRRDSMILADRSAFRNAFSSINPNYDIQMDIYQRELHHMQNAHAEEIDLYRARVEQVIELGWMGVEDFNRSLQDVERRQRDEGLEMAITPRVCKVPGTGYLNIGRPVGYWDSELPQKTQDPRGKELAPVNLVVLDESRNTVLAVKNQTIRFLSSSKNALLAELPDGSLAVQDMKLFAEEIEKQAQTLRPLQLEGIDLATFHQTINAKGQ